MNITKIKMALDENGNIKFDTLHPLKDIMQNLVDYINDLEEQKARLSKQLNEYSKDEEIAKYREETERVKNNSLYMLDDAERQRAKEFALNHYKKCGRAGYVRYIITPTGIGTSVVIECNKCKEKIDISNFNNW